MKRTPLDKFEYICVSVCLGGGPFHIALYSLMTSVLRLAPSLKAVSFGLESQL